MPNDTEIELPSFIQSLKTSPEPLVFRPNTGNPGDALIAVSVMDLLEHYEIPYQFLSPLTKHVNLENKCLLINGGGFLVTGYTYDYDRLKIIAARTKQIILLPATISAHTDLFQNMSGRLKILTREKISYSFVNQNITHAQSILTHDAVIYLNVQKTLANASSFPWGALFSIPVTQWPFEKLIKYSPWLLNRIKGSLRLHKTDTQNPTSRLFFFRNDLEKTRIHIPASNQQFLSLGPIAFAHPALIRYIAGGYLRFLNRFEEVHTNRLHAAIPSALLGKRVYFYDNKSHKCLNVYNHSMRDKFSNVTWMGSANSPDENSN